MKELIAARPTPTPSKWEHGTALVTPTRIQSMPSSVETNNGTAPPLETVFQLWAGGSPDEGLSVPKTMEAEPREQRTKRPTDGYND